MIKEENKINNILPEHINDPSELLSYPSDHLPVCTAGMLTFNIMGKYGPYGFEIQTIEIKKIKKPSFSYAIRLSELNNDEAYQGQLETYIKLFQQACEEYRKYYQALTELYNKPPQEWAKESLEFNAREYPTIELLEKQNAELEAQRGNIPKDPNDPIFETIKERLQVLNTREEKKQLESEMQQKEKELQTIEQDTLYAKRIAAIATILKNQIVHSNNTPNNKPITLIALQESSDEANQMIQAKLGDDWGYTETTDGQAGHVVTFYHKQYWKISSAKKAEIISIAGQLDKEAQALYGNSAIRIDFFDGVNSNAGSTIALANMHLDYAISVDNYPTVIANIATQMGDTPGFIAGDNNKHPLDNQGGLCLVPPDYRKSTNVTHRRGDAIFTSSPASGIAIPPQHPINFSGEIISYENLQDLNKDNAAENTAYPKPESAENFLQSVNKLKEANAAKNTAHLKPKPEPKPEPEPEPAEKLLQNANNKQWTQQKFYQRHPVATGVLIALAISIIALIIIGTLVLTGGIAATPIAIATAAIVGSVATNVTASIGGGILGGLGLIAGLTFLGGVMGKLVSKVRNAILAREVLTLPITPAETKDTYAVIAEKLPTTASPENTGTSPTHQALENPKDPETFTKPTPETPESKDPHETPTPF